MRKVCYNRTDVLARVKENREKHVKEYKEACVEYRKQCVKVLNKKNTEVEKSIQNLEEGGDLKQPQDVLDTKHLPMPENRSDDYDQVIDMLELCVDDVVELTPASLHVSCEINGIVLYGPVPLTRATFLDRMK